MPVPFVDKEFTFHNPDGSPVLVRGTGNQFAAVFETIDGFTIVKNADTGYYHYAELSADGARLVPMAARVGAADPGTLGVGRHLRPRAGASRRAAAQAREALLPGTPRWQERRSEKLARLRELRAAGAGPVVAPAAAAAGQPFAVTGSYVGLCLLIQFPDVPGTISQQEVENFCNQPGYSGFGNNGSVRDYFNDVSGGRLLYTNVVTAYYTSAHNRDYYTDPAISYGARARELILEALTFLKDSGFDFSRLSSDDQGYVYALNVFYAGPTVNNWAEGLWPHSWFIPDFEAGPTKKFRDYQITDMGGQLALGTFCHENGHMLCDLPDLYDYGYESAGVGAYCLMAVGSWYGPVQVCAPLKAMSGWADRLVDLQPGGAYSVAAGVNDFAIRRRNDNEYFIVENRQQTGRDAQLPDAGVLVWHVDEYGSNDFEQMTPELHYLCSVEQADGRFDLEHGANSGDSEDLFAAPDETSFTGTSQPDSTWWDGTPSGLNIEEISGPARIMSFRTTRGGFKAISFAPVTDQSSNTYLFAVADDGTLYRRSRPAQGAFTAWEPFTGAPGLRTIAAVNDRSNNLYLFGVGPEGTVYHTFRDATGTWQPWAGDWQGAPKLRGIHPVVDMGNRLYVVGLAPDNTCYGIERGYSGRWGDWQRNWKGAPGLRSVVAIGDLVNRVFVVGVAPDDTAYLLVRDSADSWGGWTPDFEGAPKLDAVAVASDLASLFTAFGVAVDGTVQVSTRNAGGSSERWHEPVAWRDAPKMHALAGVGGAVDQVYALGLTPEEVLHRSVHNPGSGWTGWPAWDGAPQHLHLVAPLRDGNGVLSVFGLTADGRIHLTVRPASGGDWSPWTVLNGG